MSYRCARCVSFPVGLPSTIGRWSDPWVGPLRLGGGGVGLAQLAIGLGAGHTPWPMTQRQGPLRILVHQARDLHIMEPVLVLRNLQAQALIVHPIVLGDDPFFLNTEELGEPRPDPGHTGGPRLPPGI